MRLAGLDLFLWSASFTGHVILLFVLWVRHRMRLFPVFTSLVCINIIRNIILFLILRQGSTSQYFYTFWSFAILDVIVQLGVVYELTAHVFRLTRSPDQHMTRLLICWTAGSVIIATGITWIAEPQTKLWIQTALIKGNFFSSALMSELFVGMIVLSATARLPWATDAARISQGLGLYSMATLVVETAHTYVGLKPNSHLYDNLSHVRIAIYLVCLSYWIVALWRNTSVLREMPDTMRWQLEMLKETVAQQVQTLRSWREP